MNVIDKKRLLKDGNYYKQIACFGFFLMSAIVVFLAIVSKARGTEQLLFAIGVYGVIILVPFGYFLGIKKLYEVIKDVIKISNNKFMIVERIAIDKQVVSNSSTTNDSQIVFSKDDGVWVSRKKSREIKVGDVCYVVYLENDKEPSAIYSKRKYVLADELEILVRRA